ncbi:MAG: DUF1499 domain-containing protein [Mesorhizobium sp.]|nr:DUF1499 domain-containing protein [Mesorhizobium sp.]MBL8578933.1 DUF1499 domain-containing protein [Mesorhizobium sp.]
MDEYYERRVSSAVVWSRRLAIFSLVLFLVAGTSHRIGYLASADLLPVLGVVAAFALLSLLAATRALFLFWDHGGKGGGALVFAMLVALLVLAPFAVTLYRGVTLPMLSDVSTDTDDPPELGFALAARTTGMNQIEPFTLERRQLQEDAYPEATGRRYEAPIGQVLEVIEDLFDRRGWSIVGQSEFPADATEITVETEALSPILGMPADVAIRLIDEGTSTYVDMRSSTRYWGHDFGDNAARITAFLAELDVEVAYLTVVTPVEPTEPPPPPPPVEAPSPPPDEPVEPLDRSEDPPD